MKTHVPGFPRIGLHRELKKAQEAFWKGTSDEAALQNTAKALRRRHWAQQVEQGMDLVPVGDFTLYDQMLDTIIMLGAVPERFASVTDPLKRYFGMARGVPELNIPAMTMTKWFDTNYHYIVPELSRKTTFTPHPEGLLAMLSEARTEKQAVKAVIIGPLTFLKLACGVEADFQPLECGEALLNAYEELLRTVQPHTDWIQLDEPALALDLSEPEQQFFRQAAERFARAGLSEKILLTTYFGGIDHHTELIAACSFGGIHLDLVRAPEQLAPLLPVIPRATVLSLGVVDGRNIWRTEYEAVLPLIEQACASHDTVWLSSSCSLQHCPVDLSEEHALDPEIRSWMAFSVQKCEEISKIRQIFDQKASGTTFLRQNQDLWRSKRASKRCNDPAVAQKMAQIDENMLKRTSSYEKRAPLQRKRLQLPLFPTTTIGSFPQTAEIRAVRSQFKAGKLSEEAYTAAIQAYMTDCVQKQEELGLDVLVHGEPERNDMVEYFGEQLEGICFTSNGWVQSYGSRCVKPPVIYGDVSRPAPMTVKWLTYAQSLTQKPMKGMLTGPVTILCWSFVRNDQPRMETCRQIALAIRDEVLDLERAGLKIIQIDEAAFREGLPLRRRDWEAYLRQAVESFRLTASGVDDATQIHTHMCYSHFNDIMEWVADMDADVISIEASRSRMTILDAFRDRQYPNEIGPGVYDIHSPRVPGAEEMLHLIRQALRYVPAEKLWINPDCGLKTRDWPEVLLSLRNMVQAALEARED